MFGPWPDPSSLIPALPLLVNPQFLLLPFLPLIHLGTDP